MDRRNFLRAGVLAAGGFPAAVRAADEKTELPRMKYRALGATGLNVSEISFGTYGWQNAAVLEAAVERGINLVCTCRDYQSGAAERAIAPVIKKHRDKLVISTGSDCNCMPDESTLVKNLEASLKAMGVDYVDIFLAHMADEPSHALNPAIPKAFERLLKDGKARHLALSVHSGRLEEVLRAALDAGYFEVIQSKYNFMEHPSKMKLFEEMSRKGIGVVVFKTRAGARENEVKELSGKGLEYRQAVVRWALGNSSVNSVCCAFRSFDDVEAYADAVGRELSLDDRDILDEYRRACDNAYCRQCGRCAAACPHGVDVANVMRYRMYFRNYGFEKEAMTRYAALDDTRKPLRCDSCDAPCETACQHSLATRSNLVEARETLSA